jgi:hypothetical protein
MPSPSKFGFVRRDSCPACGSRAAQVRYRCRFDEPPISSFLADYYRIDPALLDGVYELRQCLECSTFYQAEVGEEALLETLYSDWIDCADIPATDPQYVRDMSHPRASRDGHEIMAAAAYLGRPLSDLRTLDYGMGWASWARIAATLGCDSAGFDLSASRMEFASQHGVRAPQTGERFHFINTEQVFEHLTDPRGTIVDLVDRLEPGGILKISVPSQFGLERLIRNLSGGASRLIENDIMPAHPLEHVNSFSRAGLGALGAMAGLAPVRVGWSSFAFLRRSGTLDPGDPRQMAKAFLRPAHQRFNPKNMYVWLRRVTRSPLHAPSPSAASDARPG